jgi:fructose-1,6-bisphosphatase/inositol monophosphatase family enzyme
MPIPPAAITMHIPSDEVTNALQELAVSAVMPRFRNLKSADVEEKAQGEIVTIVDREVELALTPRLAQLLPGSRVIGEEACATHPALLDSVDDGLVWLVDPIDGTANFAAGRDDFAIMVALLRNGEALASWIYAPAHNSLAVAMAGAGATINGTLVRTLNGSDMSALPAVVKTRFLPQHFKQALHRTSGSALTLSDGSGPAGIDYPDLVRGRWRFILYWRTLAWDHVPGVLFASEAGAHVARLDGTPYRASDGKTGLLVAPDRASWNTARALLPAQ